MLESIIIGGVGGFIAGISVYLSKIVSDWIQFKWDERTIYKWVSKQIEDGDQFKTTKQIASYCNVTTDRVKHVCSNSKNITMHENYEDKWSLDQHQTEIYGFWG